MEIKITMMGGDCIPNAKGTWEGSSKIAAKNHKKYHDREFGSLILSKAPFILSPRNKEYVTLRDKADKRGFHIRGIKIEVTATNGRKDPNRGKK